MNPSHNGTPNRLAVASPSGTPANPRSQNHRYGTAPVAHHVGRATSTVFGGAGWYFLNWSSRPEGWTAGEVRA
jgi:hypothetical protein